MSRRIFLVSSSVKPEKLLPRLKNGGLWIYAGSNIERFKSFEDVFEGRLIMLPYQQYHDYINKRRKDFVEWLEVIHNKFGDKPSHWFSVTFSDNPYSSKLFLCCLNMSFLQHTINNYPEKDIVFIGESYAALLTAREIARGNTIYKIGFFKEKMRFLCSVLLNTAKSLIRIVRLYLYRYFIAQVIQRRCTSADEINISVIMDTYLFENSFDSGGIFKNRYFTELYDYFKNADRPVAVYPCFHEISPKDLIPMFKNIRNSPVRFIVLEDYLKIKDYVHLLFYPFIRLKNFEVTPPFLGIDVQRIVDEENWLDLSFFSFVLPYLMYKFPERLRDSGLSPSLYLNWSEGQTIQKASIMGFHRYLTQTKVIGGKSFVPAPNHLCLFITESQRDKGVAPDMVVTCGKRLKDIFSVYDRNGSYAIGASFRYAYLWDTTEIKGYSKDNRTIIVFLPYHRKISRYIVSLATKALRQASVNGYKVIIKGHPAIPQKEVKNLLKLATLDSDHVEVSSLDSKFLLPQASVVITYESSIICEAICLGIPVVLVGMPIGLDFNLHDYMPQSMWRIGYSANDLNFLINQWALRHPLSAEQRMRIGRDVLRDFFEPITSEFLGVYGEATGQTKKIKRASVKDIATPLG